jgi:hypothetical protein
VQYSGSRDVWYSTVAAVCRHQGEASITVTFASACVPRTSWFVLRVVIVDLGKFLPVVAELNGSGIRKV